MGDPAKTHEIGVQADDSREPRNRLYQFACVDL